MTSDSALGKKWFIVNTHSGYENQAKKSLEDRIKRDHIEELFGDIVIPMEEVVEMVKGERQVRKRKMLPSYILVQMAVNDQTKHVVKSTPKVIGFLGDPMNPRPVPDDQIAPLLQSSPAGGGAAGTPKAKAQFQVGDQVRVIDGPFTSFTGTVEEVQLDRSRLRVQISIFGRATPVQLGFLEVEKAR